MRGLDDDRVGMLPRPCNPVSGADTGDPVVEHSPNADFILGGELGGLRPTGFERNGGGSDRDQGTRSHGGHSCWLGRVAPRDMAYRSSVAILRGQALRRGKEECEPARITPDFQLRTSQIEPQKNFRNP